MTTPLTQKIIEQEAEFEKKYVVSFTEKDGSIYTDLIAELEPKDIILSRRQHLIELLEAEVEKWKGMLKEEDWNKIETRPEKYGKYFAIVFIALGIYSHAMNNSTVTTGA